MYRLFFHPLDNSFTYLLEDLAICLGRSDWRWFEREICKYGVYDA